jgi:hypothetical protein
MNTSSYPRLTASALLLLSGLPACGRRVVDFPLALHPGGDDTALDTADPDKNLAPFVIDTLPAMAAADVALNSPVSATFSEDVDGGTLHAANFLLFDGETGVDGLITSTPADHEVTFHPVEPLRLDGIYTATLTKGVRDHAGLAMEADFTWVFTTAPVDSVAAPTVVMTTPLDYAQEVPLESVITATFSWEMDPDSINPLSFLVMNGTNAVPGSLDLDSAGRVATFTPDAPLEWSTQYMVTITPIAADTEGVPMAEAYSWGFTAEGGPLPPYVEWTFPEDGETNASINTRPSATFSEEIAPASLSELTFLVKHGSSPVAGSVNYDVFDRRVTFTPDVPLALDVLYTATLTTGVEDLDGSAMLANYSWNFATSACSLDPVELGLLSGYAILAGSTVTSTGLSEVTGDIGVSPGTEVTGFPPAVLTGDLFAGDATAALAMADLTAVYIELAGRTLCPVTIAGDIGGMTFTPGLYKSTSSLELGSTFVVLDAQGQTDAIFVFQVASALTVANGRKVVLTNGAKAANVYWQVGSSATFGTYSDFQGTVLADQSITFATGASLEGRALARIGAVTLDSTVVIAP